MVLAKVLLTFLCMGVGSLAFATDPPPPESTPPAATAKTAISSGRVTPEQAKTLKSAGYKAEVRKGVTYYCRNQVNLGSRFETKTCGTPERSVVDSHELVNSMQHAVSH
jgi:hypothetical protein